VRSTSVGLLVIVLGCRPGQDEPRAVDARPLASTVSAAGSYTPRPTTNPGSLLEVTPTFRCSARSYPAGKVRLTWVYTASGNFESTDSACFEDVATGFAATTHAFLPPRELLVGGHDEEDGSVFELWQLEPPRVLPNAGAGEPRLVSQGVASRRVVLRSPTPRSATPGNIFWNRGKPNAVFVTFVGRGSNRAQELDVYELAWPGASGEGVARLVLDADAEPLLREDFDLFSSGDHEQHGYVYLMGWSRVAARGLVLADHDRDGVLDVHRGYDLPTLADLGYTDATRYLEFGGAPPVFRGMR